MPGRDPKSWELWGQRDGAPSTQWEQLHSVHSAVFEGRGTQNDYDITDKDVIGVIFCAVQLRLKGSVKGDCGIQLGQFFLSTKNLIESTTEDVSNADAAWNPVCRTGALYVPSVDGKEWTDENLNNVKLVDEVKTKSPKKSLFSSILSSGSKSKEVANKYLLEDPDSHKHIEKHVTFDITA